MDETETEAAMPDIQLTDEQLSAVEMVKANKVGVLTGGPGTGKTTTVNEILNWADSQRMTMAMAAPTGKAAKRMTEATGREASTIHRLLAGEMRGDKFVFAMDENCPLHVDLLVVDEVSMVTSELMADLLRAVRADGTRVLIVGDEGQLPSVGPGAVLRDILSSGIVPHTRLTKIHRNSGEIVRSCHKISSGKVYAPCAELDPGAGKNLRHVEIDSPDRIAEIVRKIVAERMPERGYDPIWDVQVISPMNSRTCLSCDALNTVLQDCLNPAAAAVEAGNDAGTGNGVGNGNGDTKKLGPWRVGDKVIQVKNGSIKNGDREGKLSEFTEEKIPVVNGDMGRVIHLENKQMVVEFFDPTRIAVMSRAKNDLLLAYAVTCHRMQGSEAPVVIVPVHTVFGPFLTRSWIYTAISRAKEICITVGRFRAIAGAIGRHDGGSRRTRLAERLMDEMIDAEEI
jgi:exodeoxyribonuclease V alpha subunit